MRILVDSNVLLDTLTGDPVRGDWSSRKIAYHSEHDELCLNPLIYAELAVYFATEAELEAALPAATFVRLHLPWEAAFLAAKAFLAYRQRGGTRTAPMPDFYIGAHAQCGGMPLLTRDARRYRTYFAQVQLIAPD